jgi:hypothetical protein
MCFPSIKKKSYAGLEQGYKNSYNIAGWISKPAMGGAGGFIFHSLGGPVERNTYKRCKPIQRAAQLRA